MRKVRDNQTKPRTMLRIAPKIAPRRTYLASSPINVVNPTPRLSPAIAKTVRACPVAVGSSFSDKIVSPLSLAVFTILSSIVRNLSVVTGRDREVISALRYSCVGPDYQLIVRGCSGCSELEADEGEYEEAYGDREDCSPQ